LDLPQDLSEILRNKAQKGEIVLGFRPEDVSIIKRREENTLEAQVYALEPIGEALIVDLMIGGDIVKVRTEADQKFKIGSHVYLKIDFKKIHLFEGGTKKRIII
jgi:multiple sugar transport system ATP-binding protein